jgi:hypothetical protein
VSEPVLREAGPEDDEAIAACIGASFPDNPKADVDVLRWQYRRNPFGDTPSWVWEDAGEIVGHYSAFPMPALLDGEPALIANAVDAATLPTHTGRGLFSALASSLFADCATKGMPVAYCFGSNEVALRAVGRAGWVEVARLRTMVLPVDDGWVARRFHVPRVAASVTRRAVFGLGRGAQGEEVAEVPEGLDDLWRRTVAAGGIRNGVVRDASWFRWRYDDAPASRGYRHIVVRRGGRLDAIATVLVHDDFGGRFAYLLELLAADRDAAGEALRGVVASVPGIAGLATLVIANGPLHRLASDAGMRTLPRRLEPKAARFGVVDNTGVRPDRPEAAWHVGWGDLDQL